MAPPGCRTGNEVCHCLPPLSHAAGHHQEAAKGRQDSTLPTTEGEKKKPLVISDQLTD